MKHKATTYAPELVDENMAGLKVEAGNMCRDAGIVPPTMLPDDQTSTVHPDHRSGTLKVHPGLYFQTHDAIRYYLAYGIASLRIGPSLTRLYALVSFLVSVAAVLLLPDGTVLAYSAMAAAVVTVVVFFTVVIRREIRLNREIDRIMGLPS